MRIVSWNCGSGFHGKVVKGVVSADQADGLEQGAERHPTLYWRDRTRTGPTFHIDYIFVPRSAANLLRRVSVGSYAKWVATGLSDHAPLIVDFLSEFASKISRTLRTAGYVVTILTVKPLQRARSKVQLVFGLLVRRAAQARRIVDGIAT